MQQIEEGKVVNVTDYGVFVKLSSGKKGLVHINEMEQGQKGKYKKLYKPKQIVQVKVLEELDNHRLKLSFKEVSVKQQYKNKIKHEKKQNELNATVSKATETELTSLQRQLQKLPGIQKKQRHKKSTVMKQVDQPPQLPLTGTEFAQNLAKFLIESEQCLQRLSQRKNHE